VRALTLALVVTLLALAVGGCGDGDSGGASSDSGYSGDTGSDTSGGAGDTSTVTDPGTETTQAPDSGCSERAPISVPAADAWRGFIQLCASDEARHLLVLENISSSALRVSADLSRVDITRYMPTADDLEAVMVARLPWDCSTDDCPVPPGGHVDAKGNPAEVFVKVDDALTGGVVMQKVLADIWSSRLRSAGRRGMQTAASCAENVGKTINAQNWETQFRYAMTGAPACDSLRKMLLGTAEDAQAGERSAAKLIAKARELSHGTWIDGLLLGATHIRP
jgi:hypothetical protein